MHCFECFKSFEEEDDIYSTNEEPPSTAPRSVRKHYISRTKRFIFVILWRPELRKVPRFLFGQSMGGAIALKMHLKEPQAWDGLILVAPMCKKVCFFILIIPDTESPSKFTEDVKPPQLVLNALILMSTLLPEAKLFPKKDMRPLFYRDPNKRKLSYFDVISYDDQTRLKTAVELLNAASDIEMQINKVSCRTKGNFSSVSQTGPSLIKLLQTQIVIDPTVSKFLYDQATSQDKTLKLYPGGYHCILEGDTDENIFTALLGLMPTPLPSKVRVYLQNPVFIIVFQNSQNLCN
ncbi:hypothetical protein YC2023_091637 [Brassica napus]